MIGDRFDFVLIDAALVIDQHRFQHRLQPSFAKGGDIRNGDNAVIAIEQHEQFIQIIAEQHGDVRMLKFDLQFARFGGGSLSGQQFANDRIQPAAHDCGEFGQGRRPGADADVGGVIE